MIINSINYWLGVASKEHVENGVKLGIAQFCHGKKGPASRPKKGDFLIYYSSKLVMDKPKLYQKFTAIGQFTDNDAYQVDMGNGFMPYRRNVKYFNCKHTDIKPLIADLNFIKNKTSWGYVFRYGFLKIDKESFDIIFENMIKK